MRICPPHYQMVKQFIDEKGMTGLVARTNEGARLAMENESDPVFGDPKSYDPLLRANILLCHNALNHSGSYLLGKKADGTEYCPLCELDEHVPRPTPQHRLASTVWIDKCTTQLQAECREYGRIPRLS